MLWPHSPAIAFAPVSAWPSTTIPPPTPVPRITPNTTRAPAPAPSLASESEIDGLPIRTPVLDIVSVGAGGGSIVWVDDGGMLRVGPQSAGADPGPACYGKGGTAPAATDAHTAIRTIRRATYIGSSPASSIRPNQYIAASGSEFRTLLCSAEIMS